MRPAASSGPASHGAKGAALTCLLALVACSSPRQPQCFVAASMADAVTDLAERAGIAMRFSAAASSTLVRQILAGAKAAVFVSANHEWMDELERAGLLVPGTRSPIARNRLVAVAPKGRGAAIEDPLGADLGARFEGRLALGDPDFVPAGRYARAALQRIGAWPSLEGRLAPAADARGALALVERGQVQLGIVYASDASESQSVSVVGRFPKAAQPEVIYEAALLEGPDQGPGRRLLAALRGPLGREVLARHGFLGVN